MNEIEVKKVHERAENLKKAFLDIQQPRSDYALINFVMDDHCTAERKYAQIVEELRRAYNFIRLLLLEIESLKIEQENLRKNEKKMTRLVEIDIEKKQIQIEDQEASLVGKVREFDCLYRLWEQFPKKFNVDDINKAEPEYWERRLACDAAQDMFAFNNGLRFGTINALRLAKLIPEQAVSVKDMAKAIEKGTLPALAEPDEQSKK